MTREPATLMFHVCSHVRQVVRDGDAWRHLTPDGRLASECIAGVYRAKATLDDNWHALVNLVPVTVPGAERDT